MQCEGWDGGDCRSDYDRASDNAAWNSQKELGYLRQRVTELERKDKAKKRKKKKK